MPPALPAFALLSLTLVICGITDGWSGKVYNVVTYPAMLLGLAYWPVAAATVSVLVAFAAGVVPVAAIRMAGGLGGGDVKLMGAVGALSASWLCVFSTLVYALVIGAAMAIVVMVAAGRVKQTLRRLLGAALAAGARSKPDLPEDSPRIPFGVAIALGGLIAGAEQMLNWQSPWAWLSP